MMSATGNPLDTILQMLKGQPGGVPPVLGQVLDPSQQVQSSSPTQVPNPNQQASQPDLSQIPPQPDMSQMGTGIRPGSQALPDNAQPPPQGQTKAHKLLQILQGGLVGGLSGLAANAQTYAQTGRNAGFGGGVGAGFTQSLPFMQKLQGQELQRGGLQNQLLSSQVQFTPYQRYIEMLKAGADISKTQAEAGKATAETAAIPTKQKLEQAQTQAAQWKEEPATGLLRNLTTGETMDPGQGGMAILDAPSAAVIGKQPGDKVPMKIALQAKQFVDAGVKPVQAGGRSLLVDSSGKTIKDLGASTPVVVNNLQNAGATGQNGQPSAIAKGLADGSMKWSDVVSARTPMSVKQQILAEVKSIKPDFNSGDYEVEQKVKQQATSGSVGQQLLAIGTARQHMQLFGQLADALDNNDTQALNKIGNVFGVQFGSDKATNFNIAAQAFGGEVGKAFDGAGVIGAERTQAQNNFGAQMSKGQFKGAIQTVDKLLAGKQKAAHDWFDQGVQAKPDFGQGGQSNQGKRPPISSFEH